MTDKNPLKLVRATVHENFNSSIDIRDFSAWYGDTRILNKINLTLHKNRINCIIGPSGSGKSTLIRSINRINDETSGFKQDGGIVFDGQDIYDRSLDLIQLRTRIGMVFQRPCIFPRSIADNVLFGLKRIKRLSKRDRLCVVEQNLKAVSLWKETSHRLGERADSLSVGQQQRLCIARALAIAPQVLLLDEPTSSLDPVATRAIEDLLLTLKKDYTIVLVTHSITQARRIAERLIFICDGNIIEDGEKKELFKRPANKKTADYLNEEFCEC